MLINLGQRDEPSAREGWSVYKYYSDHGISGASLIRPGIQKLLQDSLEGRFDIIVTESLDRLSRDQEDIAHIFKRINFAGGRIVTVSEGEINELHIGLKGTMGALYLKDLALRPTIGGPSSPRWPRRDGRWAHRARARTNFVADVTDRSN